MELVLVLVPLLVGLLVWALVQVEVPEQERLKQHKFQQPE
jgi:hypothetical protein